MTGHATSYGPLPALRIEKTGHGAGSRDTPGRPNVLRLIVGEEAPAAGAERVLVLETEIDDMSPQLLGPLLDALLAAGALDAYFTPVQMKKGRPGVLVTVIAPPTRREAIEELLFRETTTLGVRRQEWERTALERETVSVATAYGSVRVKIGRRGGRRLQCVARVRGLPARWRPRSGVAGEGGPGRGARRLARRSRKAA